MPKDKQGKIVYYYCDTDPESIELSKVYINRFRKDGDKYLTVNSLDENSIKEANDALASSEDVYIVCPFCEANSMIPRGARCILI